MSINLEKYIGWWWMKCLCSTTVQFNKTFAPLKLIKTKQQKALYMFKACKMLDEECEFENCCPDVELDELDKSRIGTFVIFLEKVWSRNKEYLTNSKGRTFKYL